MGTDRKIQIRGIKIRTLNVVMISISCILYVLLLWATVHALQKYDIMVSATEHANACQKNAALVSEGSDYLTEQVRLFTVTMDKQYLMNYFKEIYSTKRRDTVLDQLGDYDISSKTSDYLRTALNESNELMQTEMYSMKLIAAANHYSMTNYSDVEQIDLTTEDAALSPKQMIEKAQDLVFGSDYQNAKKSISRNITNFLDAILIDSRQKQQASTLNLKRTMRNQQILISILFIENILIFILIIRLIIKPLQIYINNIKHEKRLEITGSYEFKYLALTYNNIFELNAANELILRHQAEHDPLTGIMNRGAFEQLKTAFKTYTDPFAFLIIDVDKFKLVNDGYGHETGDDVLKKVAKLLEKSFRSTDYPARIGGDEFAVIVTNITPDMKTVILNKINAINETLMNPDDDLPQVSLSVGAALSECGFTDDLYKKADTALYEVKEHGRCGCRFFES
ncbi:putative diguanylate cyclase DgcT [Lachnospiraceae bacterium]|jgi:diguanylate cyclase (GGDEF)-like protein|nr:putative diguanylate cyclase DgcT [Lachnospiraceae bacterium]